MDTHPRRQQVAGVLAAAALAAVACGGARPVAVTSPTESRRSATETLPFVHDDYPKALAEAKRRKKPLFVDAWAPWCHSCQSLRAYVLTDPSLAPLAKEFVWLSVDTEKDVNAEWVQQHPHSALPTLWVIEPETNRPVLKWAGTVTAEELKSLLAVAMVDARGEGTSPAMAVTAGFVRGNHAVAVGDIVTAQSEYRAALAAAPKDHPQRPRIVEALVMQLALAKGQAVACYELASAQASDLPHGTSRATVIVAGLGCARDAKLTAETERLLALAVADASARDPHLLADDRSALYEEAVLTTQERGDAYRAHQLAHDWARFLEGEAARAKTKDERAALDPLRLNAYFAVGAPERAIPMLEESGKDFPDDYNPPARLGRVYLELSRLGEADQSADRAIARVYGPRAMRVFALKADIAKARGDRGAEVAALEKALARSENAVLTAGQTTIREGLTKRLATLR